MKFAIIAAGEGSRLKSEGIKTDKPLICLQGEPMMHRLMRIFRQEGAEEIVMIVNEEMPQVAAYAEDMRTTLAQEGCRLTIVVKSTPSSMHSLYEISPYLRDDRFCLTTVDTIFSETDFSSYMQAFRQDTDGDGCMGVTDYIDDEKPLYVGTDEEMNITGFYDTADRDCRFISGGIYGLHPNCLTSLGRCIRTGQHRMRNFQR